MQKAKALHYATHDTPCNEQRAVAIEKRYTERDQVGTAFCNRNNQLRRKNFARCIFVLHCNVSLTGLAMLELQERCHQYHLPTTTPPRFHISPACKLNTRT